ncbi:hypothetical protein CAUPRSCDRAFT_11993, partial [Caulochytrium protostelioides]
MRLGAGVLLLLLGGHARPPGLVDPPHRGGHGRGARRRAVCGGARARARRAPARVHARRPAACRAAPDAPADQRGHGVRGVHPHLAAVEHACGARGAAAGRRGARGGRAVPPVGHGKLFYFYDGVLSDLGLSIKDVVLGEGADVVALTAPVSSAHGGPPHERVVLRRVLTGSLATSTRVVSLVTGAVSGDPGVGGVGGSVLPYSGRHGLQHQPGASYLLSLREYVVHIADTRGHPEAQVRYGQYTLVAASYDDGGQPLDMGVAMVPLHAAAAAADGNSGSGNGDDDDEDAAHPPWHVGFTPSPNGQLHLTLLAAPPTGRPDAVHAPWPRGPSPTFVLQFDSPVVNVLAPPERVQLTMQHSLDAASFTNGDPGGTDGLVVDPARHGWRSLLAHIGATLYLFTERTYGWVHPP